MACLMKCAKLITRRCPQLRTIGTSVGDCILNHHQLFGFKNLLGFSLIFKAGSHFQHVDETIPGRYLYHVPSIRPG